MVQTVCVIQNHRLKFTNLFFFYHNVANNYNYAAVPYYSVCVCVSRKEIANHCVRWEQELAFSCKLYASANTAELEPCMCKVSVRKVRKRCGGGGSPLASVALLMVWYCILIMIVVHR